MKALPIGRGRKLSSGSDVAVLSIGPIGIEAQKAVEKLIEDGISAAHYDMRFVKPIDETMLHEVFSKFKKVITVENGVINGGMGSAIIEFVVDHEYRSNVVRLGIPDRFIEHGTQDELYAQCGFDAAGIVKTAHRLIDKKKIVNHKKAAG